MSTITPKPISTTLPKKIAVTLNIRSLYPIFVTLSLFLHVINNFTIIPGFKAFHVSAILAAAISLTWILRKNITSLLLIAFSAAGLASCFLGFSTESLIPWMKQTAVIFSCIGLIHSDRRQIILLSNITIPILLTALIIDCYSNMAYWHIGFYNDANYFATSLIVMFYVVIAGIPLVKRPWMKKALVAEAIIICILIFITRSRTGIILGTLLAAYPLFRLAKQNLKAIPILITAVICIGGIAYPRIAFTSHLLTLKEMKTPILGESFEKRLSLTQKGLITITDNPEYLAFGIGIDQVMTIPNIDKRETALNDHNTFTSVLSEQGIIGFLLFVASIFCLGRSICKNNYSSKAERNFNILTFAVLIIFSISILQINYLPFWWGIFLLACPQLQNDNEKISSTDSATVTIEGK